MKKFTLFLLLFIACLFVVGCDKNPETPNDKDDAILKITGDPYLFVGGTTELSYELKDEYASSFVLWKTSDESIASIDELLGVVTGVKEGSVEITAYLENHENISDSIEIVVEPVIPEYTLEKIVVSQEFTDYKLRDKLTYNGDLFYFGYNAFKNVTDAMNAVEDNTTVYLTGVFDSPMTFTKSNINIIGDETTVIKNSMFVSAQVMNMKISNLLFTEGGNLKLFGDNKNIIISDNKVYNTTNYNVKWSIDKNHQQAIFTLAMGSDSSDEIVFTNNSFDNVRDIALSISSCNNIKITNNQFTNFFQDAIRLDYGTSSKSCQWLIKGNTFKNGSYNGVFIRSYGSDMLSIEQVFSIYDNVFENVGQENVEYSGAITTMGFRDSAVTFSISYNTFKNCKNYIAIKDEIEAEKQWMVSTIINYNTFIGIPEKYFIKNDQGRDECFLNIDNNFYSDQNEQSLSLTNHKDKFIGCETNSNISKNDLDNMIHLYGKNMVGLNDTINLISDEKNVEWKSNDSSILNVDNNGKVTALNKGVAEVTIKSGTKEGKILIVVKDVIKINYARLMIEKALNEEGYVEGNNNYTKFGVWYGEEFGPEFAYGEWCAMFVSWCANEAGISRRVVPKYALCSAGMNWFVQRNLFEYKESGYKPKVGDVIFFLSDGAGHTGMVVKSDESRVYTIEGNTSNMVAQRNYPLDWHTITGYGTPNYPSGDVDDGFVFDVSDSTDGSGASTH